MPRTRSTRRSCPTRSINWLWRAPTSPSARPKLAALEVDALVDRQVEQVAAQAVEPQLDRARAHPVAAADQAGLARHGGLAVGDADADRAAEVGSVADPVIVELDQQGKRMAG